MYSSCSKTKQSKTEKVEKYNQTGIIFLNLYKTRLRQSDYDRAVVHGG